MDTDYAGSFSAVPQHGRTDLSIMRVQRKKRSKGNVVKPRERGAASECISYYEDENKTKLRARVFTPAGKARNYKKRGNKLTVDQLNALDIASARRAVHASLAGNNSDVD